MHNAIQILSVSTSDTKGGAARAAYRIHRGLIAIGIQSKLFVKVKETSDPTVLHYENFIPKSKAYTLYNWLINKFKNKKQQFEWAKYPKRQKEFLSDLRAISIRRAFCQMQFDILHLHWINSRFVNIGDLIDVKKPIVWTLHDSWVFTGICHYTYDCYKYENECHACFFLNSDIYNDLSNTVWKRKKEIYKQLNLTIVTPSEWLAEKAQKSSLLKGITTKVIPNGLDTQLFSPGDKVAVRQKKGFNSTQKYILFGAINPESDNRKGFDKLLEALNYLTKDNKEYTLVVFGSEKPIDVEIGLKVINIGFLNTDASIIDAYRLADVMVVPSISEVFGQTASESLACGTPVVAFNCSGIKEIIDHKLNGYLAEPFDSYDLAQGIIWCINNNETASLSKNARDKALKYYSIEKISKDYMDLYESILTQPSY